MGIKTKIVTLFRPVRSKVEITTLLQYRSVLPFVLEEFCDECSMTKPIEEIALMKGTISLRRNGGWGFTGHIVCKRCVSQWIHIHLCEAVQKEVSI